MVCLDKEKKDKTPSRGDILTTRGIVAAAKALKIEVHDHLVIGNGNTPASGRSDCFSDYCWHAAHSPRISRIDSSA